MVDEVYADYFDKLMASRQIRIQEYCAIYAKSIAGIGKPHQKDRFPQKNSCLNKT